MDIKLANFVLDANKDLILIDWEQSGAPPYTFAPESDGSWDVEEAWNESPVYEEADLVAPTLIYMKYRCPDQQKLVWGRPKWNVFSIWRDHCPRPLEAAEVFSFGRITLMLLYQVTQREVEDLGEGIVYWDEEAIDVSEDGKVVVGSCLDVIRTEESCYRSSWSFGKMQNARNRFPNWPFAPENLTAMPVSSILNLDPQSEYLSSRLYY